MFRYKSDLVLSKSWLNRALIIQNYGSFLNLNLNSDADDVQVLKKAISEIGQTKQFYLGQGGTSLRFFCFLISRIPGDWVIKAHPRLLERPQKGMQILFEQLGVEIQFEKDQMVIRSPGWKLPPQIFCEAQDSSQFVSALLLNSWNLDQDLQLRLQGSVVSEDYLTMTIEMLKRFGLQMKVGDTIRVAAKQRPQASSVQPELDVSSAFSLAAAAVVNGEVTITNWNPKSLQPDLVFLHLFDQMNIRYVQTEQALEIKKHKNWNAVSFDLGRSPDLFPVLAVLTALGEGTSNLYGAEQLKHKESNRLLKTKELLDLAGFQSRLKSDGLLIDGKSSVQDQNKKILFDPDHDHRMAMAAGILKLAGYNIEILDRDVVKKSYPSFWKDVGLES